MNIFGYSGIFRSNAPAWVKHNWREARVAAKAPRGTTRFRRERVRIGPGQSRGVVGFPLDMLQVSTRGALSGTMFDGPTALGGDLRRDVPLAPYGSSDWYNDNLFISGHKLQCARNRNSGEARCIKVYKLMDGSGWRSMRKHLPSQVVSWMESKYGSHVSDSSKTIPCGTGSHKGGASFRLASVQGNNELRLAFEPSRAERKSCGTPPITVGNIKEVALVVRDDKDYGFIDSVGTTFAQIPKIPGYLVQVHTQFLDALKPFFPKATPTPEAAPPPVPTSSGFLMPLLIVGGAAAAALLLTPARSKKVKGVKGAKGKKA